MFKVPSKTKSDLLNYTILFIQRTLLNNQVKICTSYIVLEDKFTSVTFFCIKLSVEFIISI